MENTDQTSGWLYDYETGDRLRKATDEEMKSSDQAAEKDGGQGVFMSEGRKVFTA